MFLVEWWAGVKLTIYMDKLDVNFLGTEHCIPIVNHCYQNDWMFLLHFGSKCKLILGNCRAFAKKSLKWIPVVGWFFYFNECIFLERSFESDQEILERRVRDMLAFTPDPLVLCLYPEGTRFTEKKHAEALKFAKERNLTPLKHHLIPRTKGFAAVASAARGVPKCPALYDYTVAEKGEHGAPTLTGIFNRVPYDVTIFVRRIPLKFVPEDKTKAAIWLHELFIEKDRLIDSFKNTGDMFAESGFDEPLKVEYKKSLLVLANSVFWFAVTSSIYIYYGFKVFGN